ncbi:MAG: hypothetical protein M2R45_02584 [Verrucomicrobia subdivision 3 bacterium]|nr:hypothetical protein [Limisphaerales bacterium]
MPVFIHVLILQDGQVLYSGIRRSVIQMFQKLQKVLSCSGIQTRTGLIEDQQRRPCHQRATNQDSLPFPSATRDPRPISQASALNPAQNPFRLSSVCGADLPQQLIIAYLPLTTETRTIPVSAIM